MKKKFKGVLGVIIIAIITCVVLLFLGYFIDKPKDNQDKLEGIVKEEEKVKGKSAALSYSNIVIINKKSKKIDLYLKNPGRSTKTITADIYAYVDEEEVLLASSETIDIGYAMHSIKLDGQIDDGKYKGYILVTYYENGRKEEMVNTKLDIDISVR